MIRGLLYTDNRRPDLSITSPIEKEMLNGMNLKMLIEVIKSDSSISSLVIYELWRTGRDEEIHKLGASLIDIDLLDRLKQHDQIPTMCTHLCQVQGLPERDAENFIRTVVEELYKAKKGLSRENHLNVDQIDEVELEFSELMRAFKIWSMRYVCQARMG